MTYRIVRRLELGAVLTMLIWAVWHLATALVTGQ